MRKSDITWLSVLIIMLCFLIYKLNKVGECKDYAESNGLQYKITSTQCLIKDRGRWFFVDDLRKRNILRERWKYE